MENLSSNKNKDTYNRNYSRQYYYIVRNSSCYKNIKIREERTITTVGYYKMADLVNEMNILRGVGCKPIFSHLAKSILNRQLPHLQNRIFFSTVNPNAISRYKYLLFIIIIYSPQNYEAQKFFWIIISLQLAKSI